MKLNKQGSLYKTAYGWSKTQPNHASLCRFFWRVVFSIFPIWPAYACWKLIDWVLIRGLGSIPAFVVFGCRLTSWDDPEKESIFPFKTISWWPRTNDGQPINLASIMLVLFNVFGGCLILYMVFYKLFYEWLLLGICFSSPLNSVITLTSVALCIIGCSSIFITDSEWWKMGKAFLKAKKEKVCPYIDFVDAQTSANQ